MGEYDHARGLHDIAWYRPDGEPMQDGDWHDGEPRVLAACLDGQAPTSGLHRPGRDESRVVLLNASDDWQAFRLPGRVGSARLLPSGADPARMPKPAAGSCRRNASRCWSGGSRLHRTHCRPACRRSRSRPGLPLRSAAA